MFVEQPLAFPEAAKKGFISVETFRYKLLDQKCPALSVLVANKGDRQQTDIATNRLNRPRGRCSERKSVKLALNVKGCYE